MPLAMVIYYQLRKPGQDPCKLPLVARVAGSGVAVADAILAALRNAAAVPATRVELRNADVELATLALLRRVAADAILAAQKNVRAIRAIPVRRKIHAVAAIRATLAPVVVADLSRLNA